MKYLIFTYISFFLFVKVNADCVDIKNSHLKLTTHTENISYAAYAGGKYNKKLVVCKGDNCSIKKSNNKKIVYEPGHPHSNRRGYVTYPDIDVQEEYSLINRAVQSLRELSSKGVCNTKLSANENLYAVKYKSGGILKDVFKFDKENNLVSWSRQFKNGKLSTIDYASRVTSLAAF